MGHKGHRHLLSHHFTQFLLNLREVSVLKYFISLYTFIDLTEKGFQNHISSRTADPGFGINDNTFQRNHSLFYKRDEAEQSSSGITSWVPNNFCISDLLSMKLR